MSLWKAAYIQPLEDWGLNLLLYKGVLGFRSLVFVASLDWILMCEVRRKYLFLLYWIKPIVAVGVSFNQSVLINCLQCFVPLKLR